MSEERSVELTKEHLEATLVSFTKIVTPAGFTHSITIRQGVTDRQVKAHLASITRLDAAFQNEKLNWQPAEGRRSHPHPRQSSAPQPPQGQPPASQASAPVCCWKCGQHSPNHTPGCSERGKPPATQTSAPAPKAATPTAGNGGNGGQAETVDFNCDELSCTVDSGKKYWKISDASGRLKKGVMIWPEVLEQYFNVETLDPLQVYDLKGRIATCAKSPNGNWPGKVLSLSELEEVA